MERILDLISSIGPHEIDKSVVHLSDPMVSHVNANTLVVVDGLLSSGYYGNFPFRYNRRALDGIAEREIVVTTETTYLELLPKINTVPIFTYVVGSFNESLKKKALLLTQDIVNQQIGTLEPGSTTNIVLRAAPTSYLFIGALKLRLVKAVP